MRIDKYLKVSRIIKRRTVATQACSTKRVKVNDVEVKPSYKVAVGDIVEVKFGERVVRIQVLDIKDTSKKEEAEKLYKYLEA